MRVGLAIDTFNLGGAETMVRDLALALRDAGHEPVLLHFGSPVMEALARDEGMESHRVPHHRLYKKTFLLPLFGLSNAGFVRRLRLDALHTHLFGTITGFAVLGRLAGVPTVGTLHDVYMIEEKPGRIGLLRLATRLGTRLVAVSGPMQRFYREHGGFDERELRLIPNFAPIHDRAKDREAVRAELSVDPGTTLVVSVGRLVGLKRFDVLVRGIARLRDRGADLIAVIVGDGPERPALEKAIEALDLGDRVRLLGERDDVDRLLAAADVFALTSETEGMSRSILEALAAGLPVVATDVGGNSDLVAPGENGFLIPVDEPDVLADVLGQLASDPDLRRRFGSASRARSRDEFSRERFLAAHLALYSEGRGSEARGD